MFKLMMSGYINPNFKKGGYLDDFTFVSPTKGDLLLRVNENLLDSDKNKVDSDKYYLVFGFTLDGSILDINQFRSIYSEINSLNQELKGKIGTPNLLNGLEQIKINLKDDEPILKEQVEELIITLTNNKLVNELKKENYN